MYLRYWKSQLKRNKICILLSHYPHLCTVDLNFNYYYRLHWWAFLPYAKARKVAEVTLFTDHGVYGNLNMAISQWPGDMSRLGNHRQPAPQPARARLSVSDAHLLLLCGSGSWSQLYLDPDGGGGGCPKKHM